MREKINRQILLAKRPVGMPDESNFKLVEAPMPLPMEGEVLVETHYISVDPYMRSRMNEQLSYVTPYRLNELINGATVGKVIESKSAKFRTGDYVTGTTGWEEYSVVNESALRKLNPDVAPVTTALGLLGLTGLTAYFGLLEIGQPRQGETIVISGAAGAVGTAAGQIARINGCHVVGIAGSAEKVKYLTKELGFDATINYKTSQDINSALKEACPNGTDIYFDNVGGAISDAVALRINDNARIIICGQISEYNAKQISTGPRIQGLLLRHSATMKGFMVRRYSARFEEGLAQLTAWYRQGKLKTVENIVEGFENTPNAFLGLFKGENIGKQIVKVR